MNQAHFAIAATLATLFTASLSNAQCPPDWVNDIGVPGANSAATEMLVLPNSVGGDLVVSGGFSTIGGTSANQLARYNFSTKVWSAFGTGANGNITAMTALPNGDFVVSGLFTQIDNVPAHGLARFSHSTGQWTAMGTATNSEGYTLATTPSGHVIAGGRIITADTQQMYKIAQYNFTTGQWSPVGDGSISGEVTALTFVSDGDLIAGGVFVAIGGVSASSIARFDFNTGQWSAMGEGIEGTVSSLITLPQGQVIVGGTFEYANNLNTYNLAQYLPETNTWSLLPSLFTTTISSLAYLDDGAGNIELIMGGTFTGGLSGRNNIARYSYSTNQWLPLGTGTNSSVASLGVRNSGGAGWSDLIVGGVFTTAGGKPANRIARWTRSLPSPTIVTQPLPVVSAQGGTALFYVQATAGGPSTTPTYQWRRNGVALSTQNNPSAGTNVLSLTALTANDVGLYDCLVTNACGGESTVSNPVALEFALPEGCPADFNDDGGIDGTDIEAFFLRWENGC